MLHNPELPPPVPSEAVEDIHETLALAGIEVGNSIRELGLYKFYYMAWSTLPSVLSSEVRAVVNDYRDPSDDGVYLHPFSLAIEEGFVVGSVLARNTIRIDSEYEVFAKRLAAQLRTLRKLLPQGGADLGDVIKSVGHTFALQLRDEVDPALITLDAEGHPHDVQDRQQLFANAVGYVGSSLLTKLIELKLRYVQPLEPFARLAIQADLDQLSSSDFTLKTSDF